MRLPGPKTRAKSHITLQQVLDAEHAALGIDANDQPRSALCISGGGIRSATFALGAIQALADHGLLDQFDYLSTVSGGGYIGGWLTAWIKRAEGIGNVIPYLRRNGKRPLPGEADPLEHLREYNNYLSPKLGFFSADTWTVAVTVLRNILLNWMLLMPLLMGFLILPRLLLAVARLGSTFNEIYGTALPVTTSPLVTVALPLGIALSLMIASFNAARLLPGGGGVKHSQGDYLIWILAPLIAADLGFALYDCLHNWNNKSPGSPLLYFLWTLLPAIAGVLAYACICGREVRRRAMPQLFPLSIALLIMTTCIGAMTWWLTHWVLPHVNWGESVGIAPAVRLMGLDLGTWIFVGVSSRTLRDQDREWLARSSAWIELVCVSWMVICALVMVLPGLTLNWRGWEGGALGALGGFSGWLSSRGGATAAGAEAGKPSSGPGSKISGFAMKLAPVVFVMTLIVGLSIVTNWVFYEARAIFPKVTRIAAPTSADPYATIAIGSRKVLWTQHEDLLEHTYWEAAFSAAAGLYAFSWILARLINTNKFSLHGMYRNRLIRAYLGASKAKREASGFTGFVASDNMWMHDVPPAQRPFHILNIALNVVSGERLAWQQRKAQSFTVSPLHCGSFELGYRPTDQYGGRKGISLGTAMTISGAAASPNMGYHSSGVVGFIMTLFNARLGSWLGNPGPAGKKTWQDAGPRSAVQSLVREAFGLTTNSSPYVYLSDSGHFENLGLYEMVLRRCRSIVVLDCGCDPCFGYEDLGNALRKIRIDLRVPIEFDDALIRPLRGKLRRCAVATIRYSAVDGKLKDGVLIYVKPMLLGNEPPDVESYAASQCGFPHESTANQWFSESQTESYRMLGLHTVDEICQGWAGGPLEDFGRHVEEIYLGHPKTRAAGSAA